MTFNYNIAQLNPDTRHPDAGYRYVGEVDDSTVLRAEFTLTTTFCPQTRQVTMGSFRAWNELSYPHEYGLVRVRSTPMHHQNEAINEQLSELEEKYLETGDTTVVRDEAADVGSNPMDRAMREEETSRGPRAPF